MSHCISSWTQSNKMKLNEEKAKYMIFTRLTVNGQTLDRVEAVKVVGVWLTTWLDWERNTSEICRKSYARVTMITKLKYAGVNAVDLINIYILYIRSVLEYCSVLWHSTLTVGQCQAIERVQKTCLKIILGPEYTSYEAALEYTGLESLRDRREARCLQFGLKCLVHPIHSRMFPVNQQLNSEHRTRQQEHFVVNKARTEYYKLSAIPYIQRKLNQYVKAQNGKE